MPRRLPILALLLPLCLAPGADDARAAAKAELQRVADQASVLSRAFNLVHELARPSVVSIHTSKREQVLIRRGVRIFGGVREMEVGEGSGFVIAADARSSWVLTNAHVVLQTDESQGFVADRNGDPVGFDRVTVVTSTGQQLEARYVGNDVQTDLAVLKVPAVLPTVDWGDSDQARVGDFVLATGYPLGIGYSATSGIISATDRATGVYASVHGYESFIQTDAAINPGNSGGPLFDLRGRVIGVNASIVSGTGSNIGLGFAIPANLARRVADDLIASGRVVRPMVGVALPQDAAETARIEAIQPGSPAEAAGLQRGDTVVAVNGQPVATVQQFRARIASCRIGTAVPVTVLRNGTEVGTQVVPVSEDELDARARHKRIDLDGFGMVLVDDGRPGLVVAQVTPGSPAEAADLAPGDRILHERSIGPIHKIDDVAPLARRGEALLQVLKDGRSVLVRVRR